MYLVSDKNITAYYIRTKYAGWLTPYIRTYRGQLKGLPIGETKNNEKN